MARQSQCRRCGEPFTPRAAGRPQIFCSKQCRDRTHRAAHIKRYAPVRTTACAECGGPVAQESLGRPRRYCSDPCKQRVGNRAQNRRRLPAPKQAERQCAYCGTTFPPKRRDQVYCEARCTRNASQMRRYRNEPLRQGVTFERLCVECGQFFTAKKCNAKWCSKICRIRTCRRDESRRRAPGAGASLYADREIFERDGWICQICVQPVDPTVPRTHPDGATIDHVVPLSRGGPDTRDNVVTAHWRCNRDKSNRI
jgi:endogenous inhibitor of DNA gyrase (YacG/DUF329 family)